MIFIGSGALLKRAITYTIDSGYVIDIVFSNSIEIEMLCKALSVSFRKASDINSQKKYFKSADKIVFSINNGQILKEPLLSLDGFRFYNIHNGILPFYRGLPEVCIVYALLNKEIEYGVSLHSIISGIDTGVCYSIMKFPISEKDTFQSIMLKGIEYCHLIFIENLDDVYKNNLKEKFTDDEMRSKLYKYSDLNSISPLTEPVIASRILKFGVFKLWYKKTFEIVSNRLT